MIGESKFTDLQPALKVVIGVLAVLNVNHLGKIPIEDDQGSPHGHDVHSHVKAIEHKNTAAEI